jgi:hypothetical protein
MTELAQKALNVAISQIGQKENPIGSNWGEPVKSYLASVGIGFPASWCLAYVHWCYDQAAKELGVTNPLPKTGGVLHAWELANAPHKVTGTPQPGDIFIMNLGHGLGHTGFVEAINSSILHTIEGNTNSDGSRNGYEVERKIRHTVNPIIGYLRY